jgi:rhamnosyltransferase
VTTCAVIVTYEPDVGALRDLLARVEPQVDAVVIIDNASPVSPAAGGATLLAQSTNIGLAAAQNVGIEWARSRGASHVLLLDQDSLPAPDMVAQLHAGLRELSTDPAHRVGAVGPRFHDPRAGRDFAFIRIRFPVSKKVWCTGSGGGSGWVTADFLISSGVLIPISVLDDVGDMDAGLFIDNVDLEWSFRARRRGYTLFGVCAATMDHALGERRRAVLFGLAHIVTHRPVRLYYIMRNRLALYRRAYTPRVWIAQDVPRVVVKFFLFAVLIGPRRQNVRSMVTGLRDGVAGRDGPAPQTWSSNASLNGSSNASSNGSSGE